MSVHQLFILLSSQFYYQLDDIHVVQVKELSKFVK